MTQDQVILVIQKVAKRLSNKYTFPNFDEDDIEQEAFIIGMEAMERYDSSRPLENFLAVHIKNRLKNFKRDNYYRPDVGRAEQIQKNKRKILEAGPIESFAFLLQENFTDDLHYKEILEYIDGNLPPQFRGDYLRFQNEQILTKSKKTNLLNCLRGLLEDFYAQGSL